MNTHIESHDVVRFCKYCRSDSVVRRGVRHNKSGDVQLIKYNACKKTFSANFGFRYRLHGRQLPPVKQQDGAPERDDPRP